MTRDDLEMLIADVTAVPLTAGPTGDQIGRSNAKNILTAIEQAGCSVVGPMDSEGLGRGGTRTP